MHVVSTTELADKHHKPVNESKWNKATRTFYYQQLLKTTTETNVVFDRYYNLHVFHHATLTPKRYDSNQITYFIASDIVKNFSSKRRLFKLR